MKLKNIGIGDFIEAKNKHGGDVGFDILEIGKSYEVLGLNENSDFTVVISVPEHKTFCSGFYVCHEYFRKPRPQLKQLDHSIFNGLDEKWRFAAICFSGKAVVTECKPKIVLNGYYCEDGYLLVGTGYDASNWQNSLIERDTAKELTGSELCRAMLARGDKFVMCAVSDDGEEDTLLDGYYVAVSSIGFRGVFENYDHNWVHATPINNQGEPLTAAEAGL